MEVYEKATRISWWLLGFVALRELLNLSHVVARKIWRRRGVSPLCGRAHRLQRRKPLRCLLVPMDTTFDLLQTGRLREARLLSPPRLRTGRESFPSSSSSIPKA